MRQRRDEIEQSGSFTRRALMLGGAIGALFSGLSWRLWRLQIVETDQYRVLSEGNQFNHLPVTPPRGRILDRHGRVIAGNEEVWLVQVRKDRARSEVLDKLAQIIDPGEAGADAIVDRRRQSRRAKWDRAIRRARRFDDVTLEDGLEWSAFARVNLHLPDLPGITAASGERRAYGLLQPDNSYADGDAFAHVVGYVARPNEEHVQEWLGRAANAAERSATARIVRHPAFRAGRSGVEKSRDDQLQGTWGDLRVEVDALGRIVREVDVPSPARPGNDVRLTLDADLQVFAQRRLEGESGACVGMDIHTGEVLCLVSAPGFDPNRFARGIVSPAYRALVNDPRKPLYNKPLDGLYPPGSTFKAITSLAILRAGIDPEETVYCNGSMRLGDRTFHCWKEEGHGAVDLRLAMKRSCDVYFYEMARRIGIDAIAEEARAFGLGEHYPLVSPGGRRGTVPDRAWKLAELGEHWAGGETLIAGIGQGFLTTSPLQLALMTARLANGGKPVRPVLAYNEDLQPYVHDGPPLADPAHISFVLDSMMAVTEEPGGTAYWALGTKGLDLDGFKMGGKTGTAQVRRISAEERAAGVIKNEELPWRFRDHALFVCFAPVEAPRYALAVVVEHGGSGSSAAAPPARDILREMVRTAPQSRIQAAMGTKS